MIVLACGIAAAQTPATSPVKVSIANFAFGPPEITIAPGQAVSWTNDDGSAHAIAFNDGSAGSKSLLPGEQFVLVFPQAGNFEYFCSFHNYMTGRVIVRAP